MRCSSCGFENAAGIPFCGQCATPLTATAKTEGAKGQRDEGGKRRKRKHSVRTPDSRLQDSSLPVGERRQLTVMFCDLVGSTPLAEKLDPEELHEVVQAYHELCATAIHRFGGYLAQYVGDGVVVYF